MKALVKRDAAPGLWLCDVPEPAIGPHDVLVRIDRTSICGTDVHIYNWDAWAQKTIPVPMTIGHEFCGTIISMGEHVHDFALGDVVSGEGHLVCGRCRNCLAGRRHLCAHTRGIGVNTTGCFAEFLAIPVTNVWHADPRIPKDIISCFDPLGNATHTALAFDVLGEDVLITGAGPIGCMAAAIVKLAGARHIVVTDVNPWRLALAKKLGATRTVNAASESLHDVQRELGMHEGFDVALEMSGSPKAVDAILDNACHGGKVALLGIFPEKFAIDWDKVIFNGLTLRGIYGREMYETWYKMTSMIQTGLDISPVITHRLHYTDFQKGFDAMKSGQSGKVVLNWEK
jgi:threonine 3-dehydrogenase